MPMKNASQRLFRVRLPALFLTTVQPSVCTSFMTTSPSNNCDSSLHRGSTVSSTLPFPPARPAPSRPPLIPPPRARVFVGACAGLMLLFGPGEVASPCSALAQFISTLAALMTLGSWPGPGARGARWTSVFQRALLLSGWGFRWLWCAMMRWRRSVCSHVLSAASADEEVRVVPARSRRDEVRGDEWVYLMNAVVMSVKGFRDGGGGDLRTGHVVDKRPVRHVRLAETQICFCPVKLPQRFLRHGELFGAWCHLGDDEVARVP